MITKQQKDKLKEAFKENGAVLAYLFGSQAKGKAHRLSDFDFGVLFEEEKNARDYFELQMKLITAISRILKTDQIDVVVLNRAKPLLKYQVVFSGQPIFVKNKAIQVFFQNRVMKEYQETKHILEDSLQAMVSRIKAKTFGRPPQAHVSRD